MKKPIILLLAVVLLCSTLTGCGIEKATASYTHDDLAITLPADFIDLSEEDFAAELSFVYGLDPIAVNGLREPKSTFTAYGLDVDLEKYGQLLISANNVQAKPEQKNGILFFTYTSGGFSYVVTLWETEEAFWTVQGYCPTENYNKVKNDIWKILSSVTV